MSFTENLYLKRMIQKLQEENAQLKNRVKMLREAAEPPMFPPSEPNQPQPQPAPEPYNPNPFPPDIPPSGPKNMAGAPSSTPGVSKPGNTLGPTTLGTNGIYYVYEYDQNGNLVRVHFYDPSTRTWVVG